LQQAEEPSLRAGSIPRGAAGVGVIEGNADGSTQREDVLGWDAAGSADARAKVDVLLS
jgi:hypothetical protein